MRRIRFRIATLCLRVALAVLPSGGRPIRVTTREMLLDVLDEIIINMAIETKKPPALGADGENG